MKLKNIAINTFADAAEMAHAFDIVRHGLLREKLESDSIFFDQFAKIESENKLLTSYNAILVKRMEITEEKIADIYMAKFHDLVNIWDNLREATMAELVKTPADGYIAFMSKAEPTGEYLPEFGYGLSVVDNDANVSVFVIPGVGATHYLVRVAYDKVAASEEVGEEQYHDAEEPVISYVLPEANDDADIIAEHQEKDALSAPRVMGYGDPAAPVLLNTMSPPTEEEVEAGTAALSTLDESHPGETQSFDVDEPTKIESSQNERQAIGRSLREGTGAAPVDGPNPSTQG